MLKENAIDIGPYFFSFSNIYTGMGSSFTLSKLKELTPHICRIRARNDAGEGEFSRPKTFFTKAQPPHAIKGEHFYLQWYVPFTNWRSTTSKIEEVSFHLSLRSPALPDDFNNFVLARSRKRISNPAGCFIVIESSNRRKVQEHPNDSSFRGTVHKKYTRK